MLRKQSILVLALGLLAAQGSGAQSRGMKVFISADMEGITGVVDGSQTSSANRDYGVARRLMIAEVNAAVAAAFDAGATEVHVADSHGSMTNVTPEELDRRAVLITGTPRPYGMMHGLDDSFSAVIFIGYQRLPPSMACSTTLTTARSRA